MAKSLVTEWKNRGYQSTYTTINALQSGGVVDKN